GGFAARDGRWQWWELRASRDDGADREDPSVFAGAGRAAAARGQRPDQSIGPAGDLRAEVGALRFHIPRIFVAAIAVENCRACTRTGASVPNTTLILGRFRLLSRFRPLWDKRAAFLVPNCVRLTIFAQCLIGEAQN